jgi:preprotein translocase subunit SecB
MADTPDTPDAPDAPESGQAGSVEQTPPLVVNAQYVKDLSFEVPGAPEIFAQLTAPPEIAVNVDVQARRVGDNVYDVILNLNATGRLKDQQTAAFLVELAYGGVFTLNNISEEHTEVVVLVECPRLLFPFARNIIADVTRDGGFPPLLIAPIDFLRLYSQKQAEQDNTAGGGSADAEAPGSEGESSG